MPTALEVSHLSVSFGVAEVLKDVSFTVERGSAVAIIGPNGSGKTVLFRALIGAIRAAGTIRWAPETTIGYVPQKLDIERDLPLTGFDFLGAKADISRTPPDEFMESLVRGAAAGSGEIDQRITAKSANWRLERMPAVDRNLLRMAVGEMLGFKGTPFPIVINEALEIGRRYSAPESINFLNGMLDSIAHGLLPK